jgi:hypothetical protein
MSLQLDLLDELLSAFSTANQPFVSNRFNYAPEFRRIKDLCDRVDTRISSGTYGENTQNRARDLIHRWRAIEKLHPAPPIVPFNPRKPDIVSINSVLVWTMNQCEFTLVSQRITHDLIHSTFTHNRIDETHLRVVQVTEKHVVVYLDSLLFPLINWPPAFYDIPLRFELSCIIPRLTGGLQPKLDSLPLETVEMIFTYLSIENMGELAVLSRQINLGFESRGLWKDIWEHLANYFSGTKPLDDPSTSAGDYKSAVSNLVKQRQKNRELRFTNSMALSDWATPVQFVDRPYPGIIDPIRSVRRRRIDVMDDLDLDIH